VASESTESKELPKTLKSLQPIPGERTLPLAALPGSLRKLLEETPRKEWYQIKAVRATFSETTELALILNALEYLRKVTPEKLLRRVTEGVVEERAFYGAYREIRDQIRALREKCEALGVLSGIEVKAWGETRGRKRKSTPNGKPESLRPAS